MRTRPCASTLLPELADDELAALQHTLKSMALTGPHLEVGTAAGGTLCAMMACYSNESRPPFVVVDPMTYFANQRATVERNLEQHNLPASGVEFRETYSNVACAAAEAKGERFDFLFIDGNHKIRFVTQDLQWSRLLNTGGLLCFHDFEVNSPGVTLPVKRFLRRHKNYTVLSHTRTLMILQKKAASSRREIGPVDHLWALFLSPILQGRYSLAKRLKKRRAPQST